MYPVLLLLEILVLTGATVQISTDLGSKNRIHAYVGGFKIKDYVVRMRHYFQSMSKCLSVSVTLF